MMRSKIKYIGLGLAFIALTLLIPIVIDLQEISSTATEFRFDESAFKHKASGERKEVSFDEYLNPPYQLKYDLNMDDYIDAEGYFSPNGEDWSAWSLRTKTAFLIMLRDDDFYSSMKIYSAINSIDSYYKRNSKDMALVHVVEAAAQE